MGRRREDAARSRLLPGTAAVCPPSSSHDHEATSLPSGAKAGQTPGLACPAGYPSPHSPHPEETAGTSGAQRPRLLEQGMAALCLGKLRRQQQQQQRFALSCARSQGLNTAAKHPLSSPSQRGWGLPSPAEPSRRPRLQQRRRLSVPGQGRPTRGAPAACSAAARRRRAEDAALLQGEPQRSPDPCPRGRRREGATLVPHPSLPAPFSPLPQAHVSRWSQE